MVAYAFWGKTKVMIPNTAPQYLLWTNFHLWTLRNIFSKIHFIWSACATYRQQFFILAAYGSLPLSEVLQPVTNVFWRSSFCSDVHRWRTSKAQLPETNTNYNKRVFVTFSCNLPKKWHYTLGFICKINSFLCTKARSRMWITT